MPSPSTSQATLRPDLGGSFMEFDLAAAGAGFIAAQVLPVFETMKQAGPFGKIPIEQLLQARDTKRAPGTGYARNKFTFTKDTFSCEEHGAEEPIDDRQSAMYSDFFRAELISALRARRIVMQNAEQRAADLIFNSTTWTGSSLTTGITNEWDDEANATPIADVEGAVQKAYDGSGMWPNALIINRKVFRNLRIVNEIQDLIKYQPMQDVRAGQITPSALALLFDLDFVIVAGETKNTAAQGQSATLAPIWSDEFAMICKVATSQDIEEPCIGRTFHWSQDGSTIGGTVEAYREEAVRADIIRVRHDVDEKVLYTEAGHLLSNVTT